ncbi:diaminopimelate decarboxylase [Candidatus Walczuchella monophlebidarum]|uniref:Diaminopimelate decarboxylase n=1 Tax=Candidatus Walczuchella monophlebidarum TaxID=1415657 RepID=A0A068DS20_9FLAO|nr:diaminopimelate decarboxylase [Candidatus Walczuchella monophlebidarum]AID37426.1 diaminopimelate decarboxylase [Candidatus Walczuchella monophlebidarum]
MKKLENFSYTLDVELLRTLAEKYGTPLYVYDAEKMMNQYEKIKQAFSCIDKLGIHYASKANTNINILKLFKKKGIGLDTVSIQEVEIGIMAGFPPKQIIYTPNGVSMEEIIKAKEFGVRIHIDNLSLLEQFGQEFSLDYPIGIRLNPHIVGGGNEKISVGHIDSKFGISYYQFPHIKRIVENTKLKVEGLHMHTGSDILDVEIFLRGADILFDAAIKFKDLEYIDFGSGFKVSYNPGDVPTDIQKLGPLLGKKVNKFYKEYGKTLCLVFEPGKFILSESGYFLVKVNTIKQTISSVFACVNSGFNHFIRPMFYNAYHNIENISNPSGRVRLYTVVGYICEADTFGLNHQISEIHEGDILCFSNAGAYCFCMSSNYNSRYRPAEVMIYKKQDYLIRQRETIQDLLRNIVEITL